MLTDVLSVQMTESVWLAKEDDTLLVVADKSEQPSDFLKRDIFRVFYCLNLFLYQQLCIHRGIGMIDTLQELHFMVKVDSVCKVPPQLG